jgi:hypothetical protein
MADFFPLKNPAEAELVKLVEKAWRFTGASPQRHKSLFNMACGVFLARRNGGAVGSRREIRPGGRLDRIVISKAEDAWFLYRDEP